jgi:diacylglycerol kinase family enzyme
MRVLCGSDGLMEPMLRNQESWRQQNASTVLILTNPKAGRGSTGMITATQLADSLQRHGFLPQLAESFGELTAVTAQLAGQQKLRCVVAMGGDGTVRAVANQLHRHRPLDGPRIPIAIVPLGTENLIARQFKMTADVAEVTAAIGQCHVHTIDAGLVNGQLFLIMFSCGFDADVIQRLHQTRSGNITHLSYAKPIFRALCGYRFPALRLTAENSTTGTQRQLESHWLFAFNLPNYARGIPIAVEANATDGQFDVCSFHGGSRLAGFFHLATVLAGQHGRWSGCHRERFTKFRIEASEPVPYQVDGDPGGFLPAEVEILPHRVSLVLPADQKVTEGEVLAE